MKIYINVILYKEKKKLYNNLEFKILNYAPNKYKFWLCHCQYCN